MIATASNTHIIVNNTSYYLAYTAYNKYDITHNNTVIGRFNIINKDKYNTYNGYITIDGTKYAFASAKLDNIVLRVYSNKNDRYTLKTIKTVKHTDKDHSAQFIQDVYDNGLNGKID